MFTRIITLFLLFFSAGSFAAAPIDTPLVASQPQMPVEVYDVFNIAHPDKNDEDHRRVGLGDKIHISVHNIKDVLARAALQGKEIKLFLNHRQIDDLKPTSGAPDKDDQYFEFTLERTAVNDKAWTELLGKPVKGSFYDRAVEVSVGLDGTYAEKTISTDIRLIRIRQHWFRGGLFFLLVYLCIMFYLGITKDLLRDAGSDISLLGLKRLGRLPYSLAKVQMAFWFSMVLAAFLFIWMITGNYDIISAGTMGLIGISASTALGAVAIDDNKETATITEVLEQRKQRAALVIELASLPPTDPNYASKTNQKTQLNAEIAKKEAGLNISSHGFLNDILTDVNGISFHRLQMAVWTVVLGVIFIYSVWASLVMPDFSTTLLTLQGITAGTYLGFKFPEKQS